jgi:hypothetical protein
MRGAAVDPLVDRVTRRAIASSWNDSGMQQGTEDELPEPILGVTWVVELPFHLGVPDGAIIVGFDPEPPEWEGWTPVDFELLLGTVELPEPMATPRLRIEFQTRVRTAVTHNAFAERWFPWLGDPEDAPTRRRGSKKKQKRKRARPARETVTIAAGTRFVGPEEARQRDPANDADVDAMTDGARDEVIQAISDYCVAFAAVTGEVAVRPIELGDLPFALPVYTQLLAPAPLNSHRSLVEVHKRRIYRNRAHVAEEVFDEIDRLFHSRPTSGGPNIFFDAYEAFVLADLALRLGRYATAARDAGTAVEIFVMTALREVATAHGRDSAIEGWIRSGFRNVLTDHLPRLLSVHEDVERTTHPVGAWLATGYTLRNDAVHRGYRPRGSEAAGALEAALELRDYIRNRIVDDPKCVHLVQWFLFRR